MWLLDDDLDDVCESVRSHAGADAVVLIVLKGKRFYCKAPNYLQPDLASVLRKIADQQEKKATV